MWVFKCFCGCFGGLPWCVLCWFCGVVCLCVAAWGVVVVVLVETGLGVGLRFCVARRFISWISALHSLLGWRVERFDRCKTRFTRRFINSDTYIAYISMCIGAVRLAAHAGRVCGDAASPISGNMFRAQARVCCRRLWRGGPTQLGYTTCCALHVKAWRLFRAVYQNRGDLNNEVCFY